MLAYTLNQPKRLNTNVKLHLKRNCCFRRSFTNLPGPHDLIQQRVHSTISINLQGFNKCFFLFSVEHLNEICKAIKSAFMFSLIGLHIITRVVRCYALYVIHPQALQVLANPHCYYKSLHSIALVSYPVRRDPVIFVTY